MRKRILPALLSLLLLCTACTQTQAEEPAEGGYTLYFVSGENRTDGTALGTEGRDLPDGTEEVRGLLELLLAGPEDTALCSPFPVGTALRGWEVRDGTAYVDLSEAYGGLTGVDLTLADGCVVLTLCQLEGVEAVYLTVQGRPRPFRDQIFTPADFLMGNALPDPLPEETEEPVEGVETFDLADTEPEE